MVPASAKGAEVLVEIFDSVGFRGFRGPSFLRFGFTTEVTEGTEVFLVPALAKGAEMLAEIFDSVGFRGFRGPPFLRFGFTTEVTKGTEVFWVSASAGWALRVASGTVDSGPGSG